MEWNWDDRKQLVNEAKHGISFNFAIKIFDDPLHLTQPDSHPDGDRWNTVGCIEISTLLVVHTIYDDDCGGRIISAQGNDP